CRVRGELCAVVVRERRRARTRAHHGDEHAHAVHLARVADVAQHLQLIVARPRVPGHPVALDADGVEAGEPELPHLRLRVDQAGCAHGVGDRTDDEPRTGARDAWCAHGKEYEEGGQEAQTHADTLAADCEKTLKRSFSPFHAGLACTSFATTRARCCTSGRRSRCVPACAATSNAGTCGSAPPNSQVASTTSR